MDSNYLEMVFIQLELVSNHCDFIFRLVKKSEKMG